MGTIGRSDPFISVLNLKNFFGKREERKRGIFENFLGPGYVVLASFGHLTTLKSLKDIDVNKHYQPSFNIIDSKKSHISKLRKAISNSDKVIIATDDDREGEGIAWHIIKIFNLPINVKRIKFNVATAVGALAPSNAKGEQIANMSMRAARNPYTSLIFTGIKKLRTHNFNFEFNPKNAKESKVLMNLIFSFDSILSAMALTENFIIMANFIKNRRNHMNIISS